MAGQTFNATPGKDAAALDFPPGCLDNQGVARVVVEHLSKSFSGPKREPIRALDDLNLAVEDKEMLVVVGPSGCGKTTLLRLLAGLDEPDSGTIAIDGEVVNRVAPKERDVAMVFQNPALYPQMSASENMAFGLKLRKCPRAEIAQRVKGTADILGLAECLERRPEELSGGQRQRVALGRAIVRRPKLFLFDEPLSNLDAPMRAQMRTEIARLHRRLGATMVYVTHDQAEALTLGNRVAVMRAGVLQQVAEPLKLYRQPANLFVAGFIGSPPMNFFHGTVARQGEALFFQARSRIGTAPDGSALRLNNAISERLKDHPGQDLVLGLRPENITDNACPGNDPPDCSVEAVVQAVETLGAEAFLHVEGHGHSFVARVPATHHASANQKVSLVFDMRQAHFFNPVTGKAIGSDE